MVLFLLPFILTLASAIEINPNLNHNQLRFPWGVNFKFHGKMHHNLARVWIVTKFKLPPLNKFHFPPAKLEPDCSFDIPSDIKTRNVSDKIINAAIDYKFIRPYLRSLCLDSLPVFELLKTRETHLRENLIHLVEKDLYGTLQSYRSLGRSKRFASLAISAVTGLVTLAVEGISGFLQDKRNKAMARAMDALHKANVETYNELQRYKDDLTLYGTYSLKSTNDVLDTLESMYSHQSSLSEVVTNLPNLTWPMFYQTHLGHTLYSSHLSLHATTLSHKFDFLYGLLQKKILNLIKGVATLSKGYLPPELFPPSFLTNITQRVAREISSDHRGYKLAFGHVNAYYDMPLATFSLDAYADIIVTFPVFIVPLTHAPLNLYEVETVPVPIPDMDTSANSYSEVSIPKPYFAASETAYFQLQEAELSNCKVIQDEYYCEETFMVKHPHHHTCESTLFYNRTEDVITNHCTFRFYHNHSVSPSVLDGGDQLVLANVRLEHSPSCDPRRLPRIPQGPYVLTSREILCNCTLQSDLAYLPSDIGACPDTLGPLHFEERPNIAFENIFNDILSISSEPPSAPTMDAPPDWPHQVREANRKFNINLTLPENVSATLSTLRAARSAFERNISSSRPSKTENPYIRSQEYQTAINGIKRNMAQTHEENSLSVNHNRIIACISLGTTIVNLLFLLKVYKDHRRLSTLTATLSMLKTAHTQSPSVPSMPPSTASVLCFDPIVSATLTFLSVLSVAIIVYQQWKYRSICRGYMYSNVLDVKLVIGDDTCYIPIKLRKVAGQLRKITLNAVPHPTQFRLIRNFMWDTIAIDWSDITLVMDEETIDLPNSIVIPIGAKFKVRDLFSHDYHVSMAICHGNTWYDLTANTRAPIHRPLRTPAFRRKERRQGPPPADETQTHSLVME